MYDNGGSREYDREGLVAISGRGRGPCGAEDVPRRTGLREKSEASKLCKKQVARRLRDRAKQCVGKSWTRTADGKLDQLKTHDDLVQEWFEELRRPSDQQTATTTWAEVSSQFPCIQFALKTGVSTAKDVMRLTLDFDRQCTNHESTKRGRGMVRLRPLGKHHSKRLSWDLFEGVDKEIALNERVRLDAVATLEDRATKTMSRKEIKKVMEEYGIDSTDRSRRTVTGFRKRLLQQPTPRAARAFVEETECYVLAAIVLDAGRLRSSRTDKRLEVLARVRRLKDDIDLVIDVRQRLEQAQYQAKVQEKKRKRGPGRVTADDVENALARLSPEARTLVLHRNLKKLIQERIGIELEEIPRSRQSLKHG